MVVSKTAASLFAIIGKTFRRVLLVGCAWSGDWNGCWGLKRGVRSATVWRQIIDEDYERGFTSKS